MPMTDQSATASSGDPTLIPDGIQRSNLWRLSLAQALAGANTVVTYATGAIVGDKLAPSPMLATLPISIFVVGMAVCTLPVGAMARRFGRRTGVFSGGPRSVVSRSCR